jgi:selenocysteine lyase/cysteine desulfurase
MAAPAANLKTNAGEQAAFKQFCSHYPRYLRLIERIRPEQEFRRLNGLTANASHALAILNGFPWGPDSVFAALQDMHNSGLGLAPHAKECGAKVVIAPLRRGTLRLQESALDQILRDKPAGESLLAFTAQSNLTGVQHPLHWVGVARSRGWCVVLDASAYLPTNTLDLSGDIQPDFVVGSWYKIAGFPSGVGFLIARKDALAKLRRVGFAGGSVVAASAHGQHYRLLPGADGFATGTINFHAMRPITLGLEYLESIGGIQAIHDRVSYLTTWTLEALCSLRHTNGALMVKVYGPTTMAKRGGTIAFNLLAPDGRLIDERLVQLGATAACIELRPGCACNPGAGAAALDVRDEATDDAFRSDVDFETILRMLGLTIAGVIRVSYGLGSTFHDAWMLLQFLQSFRDQSPKPDGLPPRTQC